MSNNNVRLAPPLRPSSRPASPTATPIVSVAEFPLFAASKLIKLTAAAPAPHSGIPTQLLPTNASNQAATTPVTITFVSSATYNQHTITLVGTSNNKLVVHTAHFNNGSANATPIHPAGLAHSNAYTFPTVRVVNWLSEKDRGVSAVHWPNNGTFALILCHDTSVFILATSHLLNARAASLSVSEDRAAIDGNVNDVIPIQLLTRAKPATGYAATSLSASIIWHSFTDDDFLILAHFDSAPLTIINLKTLEKQTIKLKAAASQLEIIQWNDYDPLLTEYVDHNDKQQWTQLLIQCIDGGIYLMLLEERRNNINNNTNNTNSANNLPNSTTNNNNNTTGTTNNTNTNNTNNNNNNNNIGVEYDICIKDITSRKFKPLHIKRFEVGSRLSVQILHQRSYISVYDPNTQLLELYPSLDILNSRSIVQYAVSIARYHCVTDSFLFTIHSTRDENNIQVLSTALASKHYNPYNSTLDFSALSSALTSNHLLQTINIPINNGRIFGINFDSKNRRLLLWTRDVLYRIHWSSSGSALFPALLETRQDTVCQQLLAMAADWSGLDRSLLYRQCADRALSRLEFDRALELYKNAQTELLYVISQLIKYNQYEIVIKLLKHSINQNPIHKLKIAHIISAHSLIDHPPVPILTTLLLQAYIELITRQRTYTLTDTDDTGADTPPMTALQEEMIDFLLSEPSLSISKALTTLLEYFFGRTGLSYVLRFGHQRNCMEKAFDFIAAYGAHHLSNREVQWLISREYSGLMLRTAAGSHLFRTMPASLQLEIVIVEMMPSASGLVGVNDSMSRIPTSIRPPVKDAAHFLSLIALLYEMIPSLQSHELVRICSFTDPNSLALPILHNEMDKVCRVQCIELFMTTMLRLRYVSEREEMIESANTAASVTTSSAAVESFERQHSRSGSFGANSGLKRVPSGKSTPTKRRSVSSQVSDDEGDEYDEEINFYGPAALEKAIKELHGNYRLSVMISAAIDYQNFKALALLHAQNEAWSDAMEAELAYLDQQRTRRRPTTSSTLSALSSVVDGDVPALDELGQRALELLDTHMMHIPTGDEQARLLILLIQHWRRWQLPFARLQSQLIDLLPKLSQSLCVVAFADDRVQLSSELLLHLTLERLNALSRPTDDSTMEQSALSPRLWSEILSNLHKNHERRTTITIGGPNQQQPNTNIMTTQTTNIHNITIPNTNPLSTSNTNANANAITASSSSSSSTSLSSSLSSSSKDNQLDNEMFIFTCGHSFTRRFFTNELLPDFQQRMSALQPPIPITTKFLLEEYNHHHVIRLACPTCVYQTILNEQNKVIRQAEMSSADGHRNGQQHYQQIKPSLARKQTTPF